jgi:hypothetical protein
MLEISNIQVFGFEAAIRGMRKSYCSESSSDSEPISSEKILVKDPNFKVYENNYFKIGENDKKLMLSLIKSGSSHRKFLRLIKIQCDVKAPFYWWTEFDTYKVSTTRLSSSTMHTLCSKKIDESSFSFNGYDECEEKRKNIKHIINELNREIELYKSSGKKSEHLIRAKQILPSSFLYDSTIDLNYETFISMYKDRLNHRLKEWKVFLFLLQNSCMFLDETIKAATGSL